MAGATGLEPATSGVTGRRSNQLSYAPAALDRGGHSYYSPQGCQAHPEAAAAAIPGGCAIATDVVGDEGFEPPTPSV